MIMKIRVKEVHELELLIGGRHGQGGEILVLYVGGIDEDGMENTDEA
jgi:hypothetical protein